MNFETILYKLEGPVLTITLNRPEVLNAMNWQMKGELTKAIEQAVADDKIRVIVLTGNGKAFSVGNDMKEGYGTTKGLENWRKRLQAEIDFGCTFWDCPKPIIVAVNGHCLATASEMAMACDITMAAESATFGEPEVRQSSGPPILTTPWVVGIKKAKELLFTGDRISAREAKKYGLVNMVVPDDSLLTEAYRLARKIAVVPAYAIQMAKQTINRSFEIMGFKMALVQNADLMAILNSTQTPERVWFRELIQEKGLKEALKIRNAKYEDQNQGSQKKIGKSGELIIPEFNS